MAKILIIGATRGLGASLANAYASAGNLVFGTTRAGTTTKSDGKLHEKIVWLKGIDVADPGVGRSIVNQLGMLGGGGGMLEGGIQALDVVVSPSEPAANTRSELTMYCRS